MKNLLVIFALISLSVCQYQVYQTIENAKGIFEAEGIKGLIERQNSQSMDIEGRIANGDRAALGDLPYQALITSTDGSERVTLCGGTLIRRQWVLTSAACIRDFVEVHVSLGLIDLAGGVFSWHSGNIPSQHRHPHSGYSPTYFFFNIGMLFLENAPENLLNRQHIGAIDILSRNDANVNLVGLNGTVSGFGYQSDFTGLFGTLHHATIPIVPNTVCRSDFPLYITNSNICANTTGGRAPCHGDNGSPLTVEIESGRRVVVGIVSFTVNACTQFPATFERISSHFDWIEERLNSSTMLGLNVSVFVVLLAAIFKNLK